MDIGYILEEAMNREKISIQASISYLEDYLICDPVFEKYMEYKNKLTIQNKAKLKSFERDLNKLMDRF